MKTISTLAIAGLIATLALAFAGHARAESAVDKPGQTGGEHGIIAVLKNGGSNGELLPAIMPTDQKQKFGTLAGVGTMNDLFINSRGGDNGNGLLLPAVQPAREAATRLSVASNGPSNGSDNLSLNFTRQVDAHGLNFTNPGAAKGLNFTRQGDTHGLNFTNPGAAKGPNFTHQGDTHGLNFTNPGAAKGLNFTNPGAAKGLNFANTVK